MPRSSKMEGRRTSRSPRLAAWRSDRPWSLAAATGAFTFVWVSLLLAAPALAFHDTTLLRVASLPVVIGLCVFLLVGVYNTQAATAEPGARWTPGVASGYGSQEAI